MYASTHMNSRGCPGGSYKRGIKTVGQAPRLRTDLGTSSRLVFRCGPQRRHFQASRAAPLSGISEGKRGRDEEARQLTTRLRYRRELRERAADDRQASYRQRQSAPLRDPSRSYSWISLSSCGDLSVLRAPLRTGAAHIVRFGPGPAPLICHWGPPGIRHSGAGPPKRGGENVSYIPEALKHSTSSMIDLARVRSSTLDGASRHGIPHATLEMAPLSQRRAATAEPRSCTVPASIRKPWLSSTERSAR